MRDIGTLGMSVEVRYEGKGKHTNDHGWSGEEALGADNL